jgi:hypothetical protein
MDSNGHTEMWVWLNPWRIHSSLQNQEERCDGVEFLQNQNNIVWWNQSAYRHERVAGMDTCWDELGISLLALMSFDNRPMVFTPAYTWKAWFPHVSILLKSTGDHPFLEYLPLSLLTNLFQIVPEKSLPAVSSTSAKPDAPYETFQLLSNRLVIQKRDRDRVSKDQELESKARSERIVVLMKSLLARYQSVNQVKIIRKLVHDCPHPVLQAKFIDLLRPVIFDEEASDALWTYINSFVKDLVSHGDKDSDTLVNVDDLVQKVEIYVGAITMIQLWCMVKGKLPKRIKGHSLGSFYKILTKMLESWLNDSVPPDDYYRLYLLEGALQQVIRIREAARRSKSSASSLTDASLSSLGPDSPASTEAPGAIVGEEGIFA